MLHEVPDQSRLLGEIHHCLKPGGKLLLAEPPIHVTGKKFANEVAIAEEVGFRIVERPHVRWSHAVVFVIRHELGGSWTRHSIAAKEEIDSSNSLGIVG